MQLIANCCKDLLYSLFISPYIENTSGVKLLFSICRTLLLQLSFFLFCFVYNIVEVLSWGTYYAYIAFHSYVFICFHLWRSIVNVLFSIHKSVDVFSVAVHIFYSEKKCPLFRLSFSHVFVVVPGLLFCLPMIAKRCSRDEIDLKSP